MNSPAPNLPCGDPAFVSSPNAEILVVMFHSFSSGRETLADLISAVREALGDNIDIYAPNLPYGRLLDSTGAGATVVNLVGKLDAIWENKSGAKYHTIIFVGHSLGGVLARRVFLAGSLNPPDYSDGFKIRDELWDAISKQRGEEKSLPCEWATRVDRLIMLATWDKGWTISDRTSWFYSIGLNILGLWGRVTELLGWRDNARGRTMLDMRKGSVFVAQTRLLWMAYRRWHNDKLRDRYNASGPVTPLEPPPPGQSQSPLVIQIIGAKDNFVSPQDQVDLDVEAIEWQDSESEKSQKKYILMEMEDTDHGGVVDFSNALGRRSGFLLTKVKEPAEVLKKRRKVFLDALTLDAPRLEILSETPSFYFDRPAQLDPYVKDVVFVMHGIRDDGYWTHRIALHVKKAEENRLKSDRKEALERRPLVSCTPTYGYFPMGAFVMPWIRRQKVEWFMDLYVEMRSRFPLAKMHYVGHSNGTYLAADALERYRAARFGQIYFAGSVVNTNFKWAEHIRERRVQRFHNARGATDWVVALLPKSIDYLSDLGGGGFDGFADAALGDPRITESKKFATGEHSGAIGEGHWRAIGDFIVKGVTPPEPQNLFAEKNRWLALFSSLRIGIPSALLFAAILILSPVSLVYGAERALPAAALIAALLFVTWWVAPTPFLRAIDAIKSFLLLLPLPLIALSVLALLALLICFLDGWGWAWRVGVAYALLFISIAAVRWREKLMPKIQRGHIIAAGAVLVTCALVALLYYQFVLFDGGSITLAGLSGVALGISFAFVRFVLTRF
ncbi:MAG: alpha/beta fold hydrolase [Methylocystis sp.]